MFKRINGHFSSSTASSGFNAADNTTSKLNKWFLANKLSLSTYKSCYAVFPPGKSNVAKVCANVIEIQKVASCRYLGVVNDEEFKWTEHIETV